LRRVPYCTRCGGDGHVARRCKRLLVGETLVETPGGNGVYAGPAKVRLIAPGVSGTELAGVTVRLGRLVPSVAWQERQRQARLVAAEAMRRRWRGKSEAQRKAVVRRLVTAATNARRRRVAEAARHGGFATTRGGTA